MPDPPPELTLAWIWHRLPFGKVTAIIAFLIAIFLGGIAMGQLSFVKELTGHTDGKSAPVVISPEKAQAEIDELIKGHNERRMQLQKGIIDEESRSYIAFEGYGHEQAAERLRKDLESEMENYSHSLQEMKALLNASQKPQTAAAK